MQTDVANTQNDIRVSDQRPADLRHNRCMSDTEILAPTMTPDVTESTTTSNNDGDHERLAHYVGARRGQNAEAIVLEARIYGNEVEALCGKRWVPSRDPQRYPVCPECAEIAKTIRGGK